MTDTTSTTCTSCGTANRPGRKFCANCGGALVLACPSCATPFEAGDKFCGECGTRLAAPATSPAATPAPAAAPAPESREAELRRVSVLFCDIVGYTTISESRDAEDVRALLSGYFDAAHRVIGRYGGTVEKFIGDAVMAVWGSPVAREDDAERAVRAALDLVAEVEQYGEVAGISGLQARVGVVTGRAASIADPREGLVVGDRVNTAARVQATAEPGTVYVDDETKAVTTAAIAYADTGHHNVKGKTESLHLWRAVRVVGGAGGADRIDGLEARFVGRARELVLLKELFHGCAEDGRARLVSVLGQAGVGKTRLKWEFQKYTDGLASPVLWHSGRCLSYGDGVAYWALAQMVRQRFSIEDDDSGDVAAAKLAAGAEQWIPDPTIRAFVTTRLGVLLGTTTADLGAEDLFAGWRLLFEQMAASRPVVLVFEDMQWADNGLLDFVEQLLDWSGDHPIFVVTLARSELLDRRPAWASGRRNATSIYLDPLADTPMRDLLEDLVPGLPRRVSADIVAKAEGVPLYAVETVRMLIDREVVVPRGGVYELVGEVGSLDVPGTLSALIQARLDALEAAERSLVKDLAVLGTTFPRSAVAAIVDLDAAALDSLLQSLVRKEVLAVRSDPLSTERGHYAFVQGLLRTVAYDTLSKHDRKQRHLRVASHLRAAFDDDGEDVAEVIAAHYRDALSVSAPGDPDADEIRRQAVEMFRRAATRATAVGAPDAALQAYSVAADLSDDEEQSTSLIGRAARAAMFAARNERALELYERVIAAHRKAGRDAAVWELAEDYASVLGQAGRLETAIAWQREVLAEIPGDHPARAEVVVSLARSETSGGDTDTAFAAIDEALRLAQDYELPTVLARAVGTKALWDHANNRPEEALLMYRWALDLHGDTGSIREILTTRSNYGDLLVQSDLPGAREQFEQVIGLASRSGDRRAESIATSNLMVLELLQGQWDAAEERGRALLSRRSSAHDDRILIHSILAQLSAMRGNSEAAIEHAAHMEPWRDSDDVQSATIEAAVQALIELERGDAAAALKHARASVDLANRSLGPRSNSMRTAWPLAVQAALNINDLDQADEMIGMIAERPIGHVPPFVRAMLSRFQGLLAAARGQDVMVEPMLEIAIGYLKALQYPYWEAVVLTDFGLWLTSHERSDEAQERLAGAAKIASELRATPLLDRVNRAIEQAALPA